MLFPFPLGMGLPENQTAEIVIALLDLATQRGYLPGSGLVLGRVYKKSWNAIHLQIFQTWIPGPAPLMVAAE